MQSQERTYSSSTLRNTRVEMKHYMREHPGCTKEDLKVEGGFSDADIVRHASAASEDAVRESTRRAA